MALLDKMGFAAGLVAAVIPAQVGAQVWGLAEVDAYAAANKPTPSVQRDDPFALPQQMPDPAAEIVISVPLSRYGAGGKSDFISATWKYEVEEHRLTLQARPESSPSVYTLDLGRDSSARDPRAPRLHQAWISSEQTESSNGGARSNAYGASVQVKIMRTEIRGVAQISPGMDNPGPAYSEPYGSSYKVERILPPEEARALVDNLRLEVRAASKAYGPGKWIVCGTLALEATIQSPIESLDRGCFLSVEVQQVRFVDSRNGDVLGAWRSGRVGK